MAKEITSKQSHTQTQALNLNSRAKEAVQMLHKLQVYLQKFKPVYTPLNF